MKTCVHECIHTHTHKLPSTQSQTYFLSKCSRTYLDWPPCHLGTTGKFNRLWYSPPPTKKNSLLNQDQWPVMHILKNTVSWTNRAGSLFCMSHPILALRSSEYLLFPLQHLSSSRSQYLLSGSFLCMLFSLCLTFPSGSLPFSGVYIGSFFLSIPRIWCSFSSLGICFLLLKFMCFRFLALRHHPAQCLA